MDIHYCFVIHARHANLSRLMRQINEVYTEYYNRRHMDFYSYKSIHRPRANAGERCAVRTLRQMFGAPGLIRTLA